MKPRRSSLLPPAVTPSVATLVQSQSATGAGTSLTVTLANPTTAGNCLVACILVTHATTATSVSTVTLGGSADNWAKGEGSSVNSGTGSPDTEIWTDQSCASGQTSIVVTPALSAAEICVWVMEWSGIFTSSAADAKHPGSSASSESWTSGSSGTLAQAQELAIGACGYYFASSLTITGPGSGWTNLSQLDESSAAHLLCGYQAVSSTAALTYSGTASGFGAYGAVILTLKAFTQVTSADAVTGADSGTQIALSDTDACTAADTASPAHASLSDSDVSAASEGTPVIKLSSADTAHWNEPQAAAGQHVTTTDFSVATDSGGQLLPHVTDSAQAAEATFISSTGTHDTEAPRASDGFSGFLVTGSDASSAADAQSTPLPHVSDTEPVRATDSGFTFVSDTDGCQVTEAPAPEGTELLDQGGLLLLDQAGNPLLDQSAAGYGHIAVLGGSNVSETAYGHEQELKAWPRDTDAALAADLATIYRPHDSDGVSAAEQTGHGSPHDTDGCRAADQAPVVFIYSYQPAFRWDGGGYEVILAHPRLGERIFWRGPTVTRQALELANAFWVADYDDCSSAEGQDTDMPVTASARPALTVMVTAVALEPAGGYRWR